MIIMIKRLFRRVIWLLFRQWNTLTLKQWPYESCKICGKAFRVCWDVTDHVWCHVMNRNDGGGGSLCVDCFIEKCHQLNYTIYEEDFKINVFLDK